MSHQRRNCFAAIPNVIRLLTCFWVAADHQGIVIAAKIGDILKDSLDFLGRFPESW